MTKEFKDFDFKPFINKALKAMGFRKPTPVQERLIPTILKGKSVVGQSQTGSGKTHTFLLPIFQKLIRMVPPKRSSQRRVGNWHIRFMKRQSKLRSSRQNRLSFTITLAERINNGKLKS